MQLKNGGILATPLNGGYPYIYTRDGVIATKALNITGNWKDSEKFYRFMKKFTKIEDYNEVFHRYTPEGLPAVTRKDENDNEGLLIHGIYDTFKHGKNKKFLEEMWPLIIKTASLIYKNSGTGLVKTERSIHEFYRLENGYEVWANSSCIRGLYDAAEIARILGNEKQSVVWKSKAGQIEKNLKSKMFNKKLGVFVKNTKFPNAPDMSQLAPFYFHIINSDKILKKTLAFLRGHLWEVNLGGFRRFRKFEICNDWHWYTGGSGSWCGLTAWAARFYKKLGDKKNYNECMSWLGGIAKKSNGLLPEHIATIEEYNEWKSHEKEFNSRIINEMKTAEKNIKEFKGKKVIYWANPLCWSQAEYVLLKKGEK